MSRTSGFAPLWRIWRDARLRYDNFPPSAVEPIEPVWENCMMKLVTGPCRRCWSPRHLRPVVLLLLLSAMGCGAPAAKPGRQQAFSMVVLPDTQLYSQKHPDSFFAQTNWIRQNRDKESIVFVMHVGDLVQNRSKSLSEWKVADEAMAVLDGIVPYGIAIGNHDYDSPEGRAEGRHRRGVSSALRSREALQGSTRLRRMSSPNRLNSSSSSLRRWYQLRDPVSRNEPLRTTRSNGPGACSRGIPDRPAIVADAQLSAGGGRHRQR
jgi:hypothetical protein